MGEALCLIKKRHVTNEIEKDSKMTSCLRSWLSPGGIVASVLKNSLPSPVSVVPCSQALLKNVLLPHECQQIRGYNNRWMREDDRNRALVCAVAPERRILEGIQVAKGIIPEDLRDQAKKDLRSSKPRVVGKALRDHGPDTRHRQTLESLEIRVS